MSSAQWRTQIQAVDRDTLQHLRTHISGGFDEERYGASIGFSNLKRLLAFTTHAALRLFCCGPIHHQGWLDSSTDTTWLQR